MSSRALTPPLILIAAIIAGCGSDDPPTDFAGNYIITVTNESDSCDKPSFEAGAAVGNIPMVITQQGAHATANVGGLGEVSLVADLGEHVFTGEVEGNTMQLTLFGVNATSVGNCAYTTNVTMDGSVDADFLTGNLTYRRADNRNPDCGPVADCVSVQRFSGTRELEAQ